MADEGFHEQHLTRLERELAAAVRQHSRALTAADRPAEAIEAEAIYERILNCFNRNGTNWLQLKATLSPSVNGNVRCCNSRFFSLRWCRAWASFVRRAA